VEHAHGNSAGAITGDGLAVGHTTEGLREQLDHFDGGVAERLNAAPSKGVVRLIGVPRVRISPPPLRPPRTLLQAWRRSTTRWFRIDPDSSVTAHATLSMNGSAAASADAAASGDTSFAFSRVNVHQGDTVSLSISFTASSGKIITVYTVGSPGGTFMASNSCSDGAPSVSTSTTGLRAVVLGQQRLTPAARSALRQLPKCLRTVFALGCSKPPRLQSDGARRASFLLSP
jgi:hypothetical protein